MLDERILKKTLVSAENGAYKFTGVLPNTYTLSISDDGKCWKEPVKKVSVSEDVKNVDFQQVGHFISVSSTRKTLMLIEGVKSKELQEVVIAKGWFFKKKKMYICIFSFSDILLPKMGWSISFYQGQMKAV